MILSAASSAVFGLFVKTAMATVFLPLMVFLRFFIPLVLIFPYFYIHFIKIREIKFRKTGKHALRVIAVIISQYSLFYYFTRGSLTDGVLLWNTAPMFMPIIMYVFYKHRTGRVVWLSLLVSFLGVVCVLKPNADLFDPFSIYGFISGVAVAFSQVLYGVNRENDSLAQNIFLFFLYSTILSLVVFVGTLFFYDFTTMMKDSFYNSGMYIPILSILGVGVGTIGNQVLRGTAYKYAKPSSLGPYIYISVLFAAFIDMFLHPEIIHGFIFTVGILLIFSGTMIKMAYTAKA
jgi:drug/metabolite transporter (DMT)-like permease